MSATWDMSLDHTTYFTLDTRTVLSALVCECEWGEGEEGRGRVCAYGESMLSLNFDRCGANVQQKENVKPSTDHFTNLIQGWTSLSSRSHTKSQTYSQSNIRKVL